MIDIGTSIPPLEILGRLGLSIALTTVIGLEREIEKRPAGLRTHMLVALGSAAFMVVALEISATEFEYAADVRIDPTRIVEGIVGGIGFLGAGCIMRASDGVKGLTTGASIWLVGAVGVACGTGNHAIAAAVATLAFLVLLAFGVLERGLKGAEPADTPAESDASH